MLLGDGGSVRSGNIRRNARTHRDRRGRPWWSPEPSSAQPRQRCASPKPPAPSTPGHGEHDGRCHATGALHDWRLLLDHEVAGGGPGREDWQDDYVDVAGATNPKPGRPCQDRLRSLREDADDDQSALAPKKDLAGRSRRPECPFRPLVVRRSLHTLKVCPKTPVEQSPRLICEECGCESDDRAWSWEAHLGFEEDGTESVAVFCLTAWPSSADGVGQPSDEMTLAHSGGALRVSIPSACGVVICGQAWSELARRLAARSCLL